MAASTLGTLEARADTRGRPAGAGEGEEIARGSQMRDGLVDVLDAAGILNHSALSAHEGLLCETPTLRRGQEMQGCDWGAARMAAPQ